MGEIASGGLKLDAYSGNQDDVDPWCPEIDMVLSRRACLGMADILRRAGESPPGSLGLGSPEAKALTRELNDLLSSDGNAMFGDCAIDDSVGRAVAPPTRYFQAAADAGGCVGPVVGIGLLALLVRGAFALWRDLAGQ